MTQEDKKLLLLKDLCSRIPYEVVISRGQYDKNPIKINSISVTSIGIFFNGYFTEGIHFTFDSKGDIWPKPYLRPMSSMTEKEKKEAKENGCIIYWDTSPEDKGLMVIASPKGFDWLNKNMFDYSKDDEGKTMIEKGLALEAPEGMYNIKDK